MFSDTGSSRPLFQGAARRVKPAGSLLRRGSPSAGTGPPLRPGWLGLRMPAWSAVRYEAVTSRPASCILA